MGSGEEADAPAQCCSTSHASRDSRTWTWVVRVSFTAMARMVRLVRSPLLIRGTLPKGCGFHYACSGLGWEVYTFRMKTQLDIMFGILIARLEK